MCLGTFFWLRPLDVKTGAVDPIVIQPVVVVTPALAAAVGWGATRAGLDKAGQVDTIEIQLVVTAAVTVGWGAAVVTIVVVVDDLDKAEVVETGIDIVMLLNKSFASLRLLGTIKFSTSSIFLSSKLFPKFYEKVAHSSRCFLRA